MMNKKASLNLSIQAIVIVVIAFVVLGLGLGFVRGIFDKFGGQSDQIFAQMEADLKDKLAKSNDPLYFPADQLVMEAGEEAVNGLGVKNVGDLPLDLQVKFLVRVDDDFQEFSSGDELQNFGDFNAGMDWDSTSQSYSQGTARPIPFTITAPDKFGNYLYKIRIVEAGGDEYASKTFFVRTG